VKALGHTYKVNGMKTRTSVKCPNWIIMYGRLPYLRPSANGTGSE
jgi:hypothetical protein